MINELITNILGDKSLANIVFITSLGFGFAFLIAFITFLTLLIIWVVKKKKALVFIILTPIFGVLALFTLILPFTITTTYAGVRMWNGEAARTKQLVEDVRIVEKGYRDPTNYSIRRARTASANIVKISQSYNSSEQGANGKDAAKQIHKDFTNARENGGGYGDYIDWQVKLEVYHPDRVKDGIKDVLSGNAYSIGSISSASKLNQQTREDASYSRFVKWWNADI